MEGIGKLWLKKSLNLSLVFLMILAAMLPVLNVIAEEKESVRTGNSGNQPINGFSEGNETIRIYNDSMFYKTIFQPDENITINVTSDMVNLQPGGPGIRNRISIIDYQGNNVIDLQDAQAFTQLPGGTPYIYNAKFAAPSIEDHYLLEVQLRDANNQGRDEIIFRDVIQIGNGSDPMKNMSTYSDPACVDQDWIFSTSDKIYIKVYTPNTIDIADSEVIFADYIGNEFIIKIEDLNDYTINTIRNDSVIIFDLFRDLDWTTFPEDTLNGYYWYSIGVNLVDLTSVDMATDWTAQIMILPPPIITETSCMSTEIYAEGTNTTSIWTTFYDENTSGINNFTVTLKLRDPDDGIITLVENETNGNNGLAITSQGNNTYNASYLWNPPDDAVLGDYDLYAMVFDNENGVDEDDFDDNRNELTLLKLGSIPMINISNTSCYPEKVNKMYDEIVTFTANFSDNNDPPLAINDFIISFKIRDSNNDEIIIAGKKRHGNQGDVTGSETISIENYGPGLYSATITWNPDLTPPEDIYDLYFSVSNIYGTAMDDFENNLDELEIYSTGHPPELTVGDTSCVPSLIDIVTQKTTMIYCEFTDPDNPPVDVFNVTFKIRPPSDRIADVISLVVDKADGGSGEFGGNVKIELSGTKYIASYTWNPPIWVDLGEYDLYFMVHDEWNNTAEDPFAQNRDELELISSVIPPAIIAGNTICVPSSVNKIGNGTTTLYCEFTDPMHINITDFNVTFKVRDPNDQEIILVNNVAHGGKGEGQNQDGLVSITYSGTVFTASYEWDPAITTLVGRYDLYFGVQNIKGGYAKDKFENNLNELEIATTGYPPVIIDTNCIPNKIDIKGLVNTTISAEFTDDDDPGIENFTVTFKVRDPDGNIIVLADSKTNGSIGDKGGLVSIETSQDGYSASINWDPENPMIPGKYDLYFSVKDNLQFETIDGFNKNLDELELIGEPIQPGLPKIVYESPTNVDNKYTFKVTYTDPEGDKPNDLGIILFIGEITYKMIEQDPNDDNYTDGKVYYYTKEFNEGLFEYHFKVTNENNQTFESDKENITVEPKKKDDGSDDSSIIFTILGIFLILVILFLIIFFVIKKQKRPRTKEETEPPQAALVTNHEPGDSVAPMARAVDESEVDESETDEEQEPETKPETEMKKTETEETETTPKPAEEEQVGQPTPMEEQTEPEQTDFETEVVPESEVPTEPEAEVPESEVPTEPKVEAPVIEAEVEGSGAEEPKHQSEVEQKTETEDSTKE
jgi:hypothetical protein